MRRLDPASSILLVVDVQEKLWAAMPEDGRRDLERASHVLLEALPWPPSGRRRCRS
jgi:hypothetical protein